MFEWLATHGYVVACITSVGRYPGNMSMKKEDVLEQVEDGAFAMHLLKSRNKIDSNRMGLIGYSWGGLAAWILSTKEKNIKAVLSLDGSEMHHYGESADEDKDFDSIRHSFFIPGEKTQAKYAYLAGGAGNEDQQMDSVFNIFLYSAMSKQLVFFPGARHEDFSVLPFVAADISHSKNASVELYHSFEQLSLDFFNQYLKNDENAFSNRLAEVYASHQGDSIYPAAYFARPKGILIKGKIVEEANGNGLAYVNVGIPDKNVGTVSGRDGSFEIRIDSLMMADSLKISMVGYHSRSLALSEILKGSRTFTIALQQKTTPLQEVVVIQKKPETKTLGNKTTSTFVSVVLPLKFLGSEIGIRIDLGKKPVFLKSFSFNVSGIRLDTATFRMNIYRFKNGTPQENLLQKNILVGVGKRTGKYIVPLGDYKLLLKDDILISLEWIEGSASGSNNGAMFLSAAFLNSPTWHRLTSQAKWKKASGLGVGFNIDVQKINSD
jgi:hypothetical protein